MEKEEFFNLIDQFSEVASLSKWRAVYDKKLDNLYWRKSQLSKNTKLVKVSHETFLYLSPKREVEGVFVEYFKNNFTKHNKRLRRIIKLFDKKIGESEVTLSKSKIKTNKTKDSFEDLADGIKLDIFRDACKDKKTIGDLNFVISTALAG